MFETTTLTRKFPRSYRGTLRDWEAQPLVSFPFGRRLTPRYCLLAATSDDEVNSFVPITMPKINLDELPVRVGTGYPSPFNDACAGRTRRRLGDAGGLSSFGVNLTTLPPGKWSSQRHWHTHEDEFVYVLGGELTLVEDGAETTLHAGDCAAFPKGSGNGHHLQNRGTIEAVYLEVGSRHPDDLTTCSDVDLMSSNRDGVFVHKDGSPYP